LTRGSTPWGRSGLTMKASQGVLVRGAPSQRRASRQLSRATPMGWRMADGHIPRRTKVYTIATMGSSFHTPGTVWPCHTSICIVVVSCARAVSTGQRWRDQRSQVRHTGDLRVEARGDQRHLPGPEARRADAIRPLLEPQGLGQGGQGLADEPRGTGRRCQPRDELIMDAERVPPSRAREACDGWRPPVSATRWGGRSTGGSCSKDGRAPTARWLGKGMISLAPSPHRTVRTSHLVHGSSHRRTPRGALLL
jgi:hypothetical protein